jgi:predicted ester cyclase
VTPAQYALEIASARKQFPDLRFTLRDHVIHDNKIWCRFSFRATEITTGKVVIRGTLQIYRLENGKLAETWFARLPDGVDW